MRSLITMAAVSALSVGAAAQATPLQLTTGFTPTFFTGAIDATVMFDLTVTDPAGVTLFNIGHNLNFAAGQTTSCDVYIVDATEAGGVPTFRTNELIPAYWDNDPMTVDLDPDFSSSIVTAGANLPSNGAVPGGYYLPPGDYAVGISYNDGGPLYAAFSGANGMFSNAELMFDGGSVAAGPFAVGLFGGSGLRIFNGNLDYYSGNVPVASAVAFGDECPAFNDAALVVEQFGVAAGAPPSDLTGSNITFTPNMMGGYVVTGSAGSGYVAPGGGAMILAVGDDTLSGPIALTNTVTGPGGVTTNTVEVDSNGRVLFDATANTATIGGPGIGDFINSVSNIQIGADYDPSVGGTVTVEEIGTDVVFTWDSVPEFGQTGTFTTQIVLSAGGAITFRFDNFFPVNLANVGISQGAPFALANDVIFATDLSATIATPIDTGMSAIGIRANPVTAPTLGGSLGLDIVQVPPTAIGTFLLIGFSNPGLDLTALGAPGCVLRSSGESTTAALGGPFSLNIPNNPNLTGLNLLVQAAALDPGAGNPFFLSLGNGIDATVQAQ